MSKIGRISSVVEITSYDELKLFVGKKERTILFIGTDWCSQSRSMAKVIAELSREFPEISFLVVSLEDNEYTPFAAKEEFKFIFAIEAYPTLLIFSGNEIVPMEKVVSEKSLEKQKEDVVALIKRAA